MKPQKQLNRHDPASGIYGDCFRTCIACLLDLPATDVPHVFDSDVAGETGHAQMDAWLADRRLRLIWVPFDSGASLKQVLDTVAAHNPGLHVMLGVQSKPGVGHFVIAKDGEVVWDPSGAPTPDLQPHMDGYWWAAFIGAHI